MVQQKKKNMTPVDMPPISDHDSSDSHSHSEVESEVEVEVDTPSTSKVSKSTSKKNQSVPKNKKENKKEKASNMSDLSDPSDPSDTEEEEVPKEKKKIGPNPVPKAMAKRVLAALKEKMSPSHDVPVDKIQDILNTYRTMTIDDVANGQVVSEPNFLTYKRKLREERVHTNPKTGEPIVKPRHYVLSVEVKANTKDRFAEIPLTPEDIETLDVAAQKKSMKKKA